MANASLSINSASTNSANISFTTSGWVKPQDDSDTTTSSSGNTTVKTTTTTTYGNLVYSWTFGDGGTSSSSQSGTRNYTGLTAGQENTISGIVKVTCSKTVQTNITTTTVTPTEGGGSSTSTSTQTGTPTTTIIELNGSPLTATPILVYTKPIALNWSVNVGDYIQDKLTAVNWGNLITQLGKYRSYKDKEDKYSTYNYLKVSSGTIVTASLFNQVASAAGIGNVATVGNNITAAAVNTLINAVNSG